jgi:hypothetical protein
MFQADRQSEPQFTQPVNQILTMLGVTLLVGIGVYVSYSAIAPIFLASPYLNGFIIAVFFFGLFACYWQVLTLISSVSWIEGFALNRPGHEFVKAPGLLASLAVLLRAKGARHSLTSTSTRSIQDSVATRLDEGREITRYIINLLIFLGLLGTFYGLATTVPAVVDTIRSLAPQDDGQSARGVFDNLMSGLEKQLGGMGTAFGSSLLGLAGSLVVGVLDLFAGHGQNRFYRELEYWLSSITRLGIASPEGDIGNVEQYAVAELLEHTTQQLDTMQTIMLQSQERRNETDARIDRLSLAIEELAKYSVNAQAGAQSALESIAEGQAQVTAALTLEKPQVEDSILDAESRMRLRNIDTQLLRILEEMSAGRQDTVSELRSDLAALTKALRASRAARSGG